uniref:Uncharacterized protein T26N6.16 n=1 Tax=Arabidopsis thaliana TaxID=3702 RepID=Q9XED1_ARATH|nr:hypothetical protein [Arabidopsis thaliana]
MGDDKLPKRLFRLGAEPEGRKRINKYFTLWWIEIIKAALDEEHLQQLDGSQFRSILQMGTHQFSIMFLHYILSRQLVTDKKYEMWWLFAGKPICFCIDDFALVTGLNCSKAGFKKKDARTRGNMKAVQNPTRFYKFLFDRITSLLNEELLARDIDLSFCDEEDDEEVSHLLSLLMKEHPFKHNSLSGGVDACDVVQPSDDEFLADEGMNPSKSDGEEEMEADVPGGAMEERQEGATGECEDGMDADFLVDDRQTQKDDGNFLAGEDLQHDVPIAGETQNSSSALIKEAPDEFEEVVSGQNRQKAQKGESNKCVAESCSTKEHRSFDQPGHTHVGSQPDEPEIGLAGGSDSVAGVCGIIGGLGVLDGIKTDTLKEVRGDDASQKRRKKKSSSDMDAQSTRPLKRVKEKDQVSSTKIGNTEELHANNPDVNAEEHLDDDCDVIAPNVLLGLPQETVADSSRLPPKGKKKTSPRKVTVLRSSNRIRDSPVMSNRRESRPTIPVQQRQTAVRGSTKVHVVRPGKWEKIPPNPPPSFIELRRQYNKFCAASDKSAFYFPTLTRVPFMVQPKWFDEVDVIYCRMQVERQHWVGLVINLKKWEVIVLDCKREVLNDEHVAKYIEHIIIMLLYLIRNHGVNGRMLTQRLDPMTMSRPNLQFNVSSLGLVGIACVILLELHSVNAMDYCAKLDEEKMRGAAKQYAIKMFNALSPETRTA